MTKTELSNIARTTYAMSHDDGEVVAYKVGVDDLIEFCGLHIDEDGEFSCCGDEFVEIDDVECYLNLDEDMILKIALATK